MPEQLKCAACGGTFGMSTELQSHVQSAHRPTQYKCAACGASFKTKPEHDQHARAAHGMR